MVEIAKTFTLYKLADTTFTLSDSRADRALDAFGKMAYGVNETATIYLTEEYGRRHAMPTFILDIFLRYYRVNNLTEPVADITTPVNELYHYVYGATPLETVHTAEKQLRRLTIPLKDAVAFRETYWDNVLFIMRVLESVKVRDLKKSGLQQGSRNERLRFADYRKTSVHSVYKQALKASERTYKELSVPKQENIRAVSKTGLKTQWKRNPAEQARISDKETARTKKVTAEEMAMKERPIKAVFINPCEVVILVDDITASFNWFRTARETLAIADRQIKAIGARRKETLAVKDRPYKSVKAKKSETFTIAGRYGGHPGKVAAERLSLSDRQTKKLTAVRKDAIHVKPVLAKALRRSFRTAIKAIDGYASHAKPLYSDRLKLTDGEKNMLAIVRKEMMHITEIYWDNVLFLIHITENIRTTDALQKAMSVQMRDSFRFLDWLSKCPGLNKRDSVDIAEGERKKIEHVLYDSLNLLDGLRRDMRHIVSEKLKSMDALSRYLMRPMQEGLAVSDGIGKYVKRPLRDEISVIDGSRRAVTSVQSEYISALDTAVKKAISVQNEHIYIEDGFKRMWHAIKEFREELQAIDAMHRDIYHKQDERIAVADKILIATEKSLKEAMETEESFNRTAAFKRGFCDLVSVGDGLIRDVGKSSTEDIAIYDAFVRASNAYIESIQVYSDVKDAAGFSAMADTPPMYEAFTDFNVGDYEYEKALMRLRVISNATHSQPLLYDVSPHVDIDDTDDKGQVQITDTTAATKVYYNKHYYNAPEVNAMVKGSTGTTTPVPNILSTDGNDDKGRYFEIELLNSSGNRTTGIVSWVAKGW